MVKLMLVDPDRVQIGLSELPAIMLNDHGRITSVAHQELSRSESSRKYSNSPPP